MYVDVVPVLQLLQSLLLLLKSLLQSYHCFFLNFLIRVELYISLRQRKQIFFIYIFYYVSNNDFFYMVGDKVLHGRGVVFT